MLIKYQTKQNKTKRSEKNKICKCMCRWNNAWRHYATVWQWDFRFFMAIDFHQFKLQRLCHVLVHYSTACVWWNFKFVYKAVWLAATFLCINITISFSLYCVTVRFNYKKKKKKKKKKLQFFVYDLIHVFVFLHVRSNKWRSELSWISRRRKHI